jgi:hypothetical protein
MQENQVYLCSELVRISTGRNAAVGNLESITPKGCTLSMPQGPPVGTPIRMQCLECPQGKKSCTECVFRGRVARCTSDVPLGSTVDVHFDGCIWSPQRWHPRHLTDIAPGLQS